MLWLDWVNGEPHLSRGSYPSFSMRALNCRYSLFRSKCFTWKEGSHYFSASACNTDTTPNQPHRNSNTHQTKNNTTKVVIQQNSRELLMIDILMSETCWAHKKWNKIASDIKLVFYSSTITMMHGPINIRCTIYFYRMSTLVLDNVY